MHLFLRLVLIVLAGALIMGARVATRHCASMQPTTTALPLANGSQAAWASHSPFPLGHWAAVYEKPLPQPVSRQFTIL